MPNFQTYNIVPTLPAALEPLREVSFNVWWTWEPSARRLFRHLDPELWNRTNHNPIRMLQLSRQARLEELATDKTFLRELKQVYDAFQKYLTRKDTYGKSGAGAAMQKPVAYFSAEFGFHESIPNYSGGLGILSGDHCKSASDLDLNFVAIGLLYRHGYFRQEIDKDGIQHAVSLNQNFHHLPIREVRSDDRALLVPVRILDRDVYARVWELQVGRVKLYLLDTDIPENNAEDRLITAELYGGDLEMRMRQEIVLGIGGVNNVQRATSRALPNDVWTGVPAHEVPITHIAIGIQTKTSLAPEFLARYDKYLGDWEETLTDADFWRRVMDIPDAILWDAHQKLKLRLVEFVRGRVKAQRERIGESPESIRAANRILDPEILTIGFARRFATYKRGALLFTDKNRLHRLLNDSTRPVQFIFAGKAHPRDEGGKALIQEVYKFSRESGFDNRIVFVEDYDTYIARRLVQAVDLWLNNPLRPLEASGTSGMKTPPNGGLNLSVLDGWWGESYNGNNGWAIGAEIKDGTVEFQNEVDSSSLYQLLENQIIPLYYAKPDGKLPLAWLQLMRELIRSVTPVFNTHRMVKEYTERLYAPAAQAYREFSQNDCAAASDLSQWKTRIRKDWPQIRIDDVQVGNKDRQNIPVGESLEVSARVHLGAVDPQHVRVEAYHGEAENGGIKNPDITMLNQAVQNGDGTYLYRGSVPASESGAYGFSIRVLPTHPHLQQDHELRLITWS